MSVQRKSRWRAEGFAGLGTRVVALVGVVTLAAACSSGSSSGTSTAVSAPTPADPVAAAQARVQTAQSNVTTANDALTAASQQFCSQGKDYVTAVDRYGKLFTDHSATVGVVKTLGADLVAPRAAVSSAASTTAAAKTMWTTPTPN